jgi:hypothetical protein
VASGRLLLAKKNIRVREPQWAVQGQLSRFIVMSPFAGFVGRQLECWCASQRQPPNAAGAELDCVTAASFAIQPCIKGKRLGKYESTYVPMHHHIHPHCLNRTVPHLMLPCDLQMSGTERRICGRWKLVITASTNMRRAWW